MPSTVASAWRSIQAGVSRAVSPNGPVAAEPPHLVHTGFELVLMIDGRKPFARMGGVYPPHQHYDEDLFDRYVASGYPAQGSGARAVRRAGAVPGWPRLGGFAHCLLHAEGPGMAHPSSGSSSPKASRQIRLERPVSSASEGMLFGYEEWQNDWWLDDIRRFRNIRWVNACQLYLAVNRRRMLSGNQTMAGCRALPLRETSLLKLSGCAVVRERRKRRFARRLEAKSATRLLSCVSA